MHGKADRVFLVSEKVGFTVRVFARYEQVEFKKVKTKSIAGTAEQEPKSLEDSEPADSP